MSAPYASGAVVPPMTRMMESKPEFGCFYIQAKRSQMMVRG